MPFPSGNDVLRTVAQNGDVSKIELVDAPMTRLAGWTIPLLMTHGRLIALKGRSAQAEVEKARKSIVKAGGCDPQVLEAPVGADLESTHVVVIRRR